MLRPSTLMGSLKPVVIWNSRIIATVISPNSIQRMSPVEDQRATCRRKICKTIPAWWWKKHQTLHPTHRLATTLFLRLTCFGRKLQYVVLCFYSLQRYIGIFSQGINHPSCDDFEKPLTNYEILTESLIKGRTNII